MTEPVTSAEAAAQVLAKAGASLNAAIAEAGEAIGKMASLAGDLQRAASLIRQVPDFPEPGVLFYDIGPALADTEGLKALVYGLATVSEPADVVVGIEARGFLLGSAVAYACGLGVVGVRKPGKLPLVAHRVDYELEYGTASLELPADALKPGQRVLVVDDVLATGGTLEAACKLVEHAGAEVVGASLVLELAALGGRQRLARQNIKALFTV